MDDDRYESDAYVNPQLSFLAELSLRDNPKLSGRIYELIKRREDVNNKAIEIIEDKGMDLCGSLCSLYAEENEGLTFAIEMGWVVDQFGGVASIFNRLSAMCVETGDMEEALLLRIFAIAADSVGIEKSKSEEFDSILRRTYNLEMRLPTEQLWDEAHARMVLEQTETDAIWEQVQKERENDDELD